MSVTTLKPTAIARDGLPPGQRGRAMAAVLTGVALATLDTAIANTALPTIAADLGVDPGASVWIVNAYQLAVVATLLPIAALGEIVGQRRIYVAGLALGMGLLALLPTDPSIMDIIWRMAICGAGFGFFQAPNLRAIMTSAPAARSGGASGIVATARLLDQTLGAALVAACFAIAGAHGPAVAMGLGAAFAGVASVVSFTRLAVAC